MHSENSYNLKLKWYDFSTSFRFHNILSYIPYSVGDIMDTHN